MSPTLWFIILCGAAFLMFALEVFIPDLILATVGVICLIGACVMAFQAFPPTFAMGISLALVTLTIGGFIVWLVKMPDSRAGKMISLNTSLESSQADRTVNPLIGKRGTAETDLRPGGFARIDDRRMDVVLQRGYLDAGKPIEVVEVHGNRIVVKPVAGDLG